MKIKNKNQLIEELNNLPCSDNGFIYQNYCLESGSGRQYFLDENGKKLIQKEKRLKSGKN